MAVRPLQVPPYVGGSLNRRIIANALREHCGPRNFRISELWAVDGQTAPYSRQCGLLQPCPRCLDRRSETQIFVDPAAFIVSYPLSLLDRSARAEYIVPPNSEGRVASLSMRSTPASVKSWRSRSKPTGYGPHLFGLDRSYSTIKKRSVTDRRLLRNICCS